MPLHNTQNRECVNELYSKCLSGVAGETGPVRAPPPRGGRHREEEPPQQRRRPCAASRPAQ
eukprot:1499944-Rhodomonas_salina.1